MLNLGYESPIPTKKINVLIADDDSISRRILEKNISKWGYKTIIAKNGTEAWQSFNNAEIRLAILDWMMPDISGVNLCKKIRQKEKNKYIYIIILTVKYTKEDIIKGLSAGADDYVIKPFDNLELKARLQTGKRIIELENQLLQSKKKLVELATRDSLTKLWNRPTIIQHLNNELDRSFRKSYAISILLVDIDNFKKINDTYGHHTGDFVLVEVANRLKNTLRPYDKMGRYGGDELLVVLPACSFRKIKHVAERLRLSISRKKIKMNSFRVPITISLGGISYNHSSSISSEDLIKTSDNAMYEAKEKGRNCIVIRSLPNISEVKK